MVWGMWKVRSHAEPAPQSPLVIPCKHICKFPMSRPGLSLGNLEDLSSRVPSIISDFLNVAHLLLIVTSFCLQALHFSLTGIRRLASASEVTQP